MNTVETITKRYFRDSTRLYVTGQVDFVRISLISGTRFKFLMIHPNQDDERFGLIPEHDERTQMHNAKALRAELERRIAALYGLKELPKYKGKLKVRALKEMPVLTLTVANSKQPSVKYRVEVRAYEGN
jgi:hypothetical protein